MTTGIYILKETKTYPSHILFVESNSFGDQILTVRHETVGGRFIYHKVDLRHEGSWIEVNDSYLKVLKERLGL